MHQVEKQHEAEILLLPRWCCSTAPNPQKTCCTTIFCLHTCIIFSLDTEGELTLGLPSADPALPPPAVTARHVHRGLPSLECQAAADL